VLPDGQSCLAAVGSGRVLRVTCSWSVLKRADGSFEDGGEAVLAMQSGGDPL
jgi:hypothetical protein